MHSLVTACDCVLQISDFGMSRGLREGTYYMSKGGKIPIKWTAPEVIDYAAIIIGIIAT